MTPQKESNAAATPVACESGRTITTTYTEGDFNSAQKLRLDSIGGITIGGGPASDAHDLARVRHIAVAPTGMVLLATSAPTRLLVANPESGVITTLADEGEGPGQVRDIGGFLFGSVDSTGVFDPINARISWFDGNPRYLGSTALTTPDGTPLLHSTGVALEGVLPRGRLVVSTLHLLDAGRGSAGADQWRAAGRIEVITMPGDSSPTAVRRAFDLATFDMEWQTLRTPGGNIRHAAPLRFTRRGFVGVVAGKLVASTPENDGFTFCGEMGETSRQVRLAMPPRGVTPAMIDAAVAAESLALTRQTRERRPEMREVYAGLRERSAAAALPLVHRAFAAPDRLWFIRSYADPDSGWEAVAIAPDGALVGRLVGGSGPPPFAMTESSAIFRESDEDGVITFRIVRVAAGRE